MKSRIKLMCKLDEFDKIDSLITAYDYKKNNNESFSLSRPLFAGLLWQGVVNTCA